MSTIIFPSEVTVTDQVVDCTTLSEAKKAFAIDFTKKIIAQYKTRKTTRVCFGIAGPSGSGKSFLSVLARELAKQIAPAIAVVPVSIDAFHFPSTYLEHTHKEGISLKQVKGRYDTYDIGELVVHLEKYKHQLLPMHFPEYSRKIHEPIAHALRVDDSPTILLVEGLWLLYKSSGWEQVQQLLDYSYYIDDVETESQARTIKRHVAGGRSESDAEEYYQSSDAKNRELVLSTRTSADKILVWPS